MGEIFQAAGAVAEGEAQYKAAKYNAALLEKMLHTLEANQFPTLISLTLKEENKLVR